MAFIDDLLADREDAPARTDGGLRWSCLPDTGLDEVFERPAECFDGETLVHGDVMTRHGIVVPRGESPDQRVPAAQRIDADDIRALFAAMNILGHIHHPIMYGTIYNAGEAGDNYYQELVAEIVSVSGATMTVAGIGWNPKRIQMGRSRLNPAWPLPDPATGSTGRIVYEQEAFALMTLSAVEFLLPSVLAGKLRPFVMGIIMPGSDAAGASFTVELSNNVSHAKEPYDEAFPPADGKYYCRFLFFAFRPARWPNVQATGWAHWKRRTQTVSAAAAASAPVALLNGAAGGTRVLWPGMMPGALRVLCVPGAGSPIELVDAAARLVDVQSGGGWATTIDLQDIATAFEEFEVTFWAEAVSGETGTLPFPGRCLNSQSDPSGSHVHAGGRRCTARADASRFDRFKAECYQPGACSRFCLPGFQDGNAVRPPTDLTSPNLFAAAVCGTSWVLVQAVEGFSGPGAFRLERPPDAMDSLMELVGGWSGGVPTGKFPRRVPWYGPSFGQLVVTEDGDGNLDHAIQHGAFVGAGSWTAGATPPEGLFPAEVGGFADELTDWRGEPRTARLARYLQTPAGTGHLYDLDVRDEAMSSETRLVESEAFAIGLDPGAAANAQVQEAVLAIVNGTG